MAASGGVTFSQNSQGVFSKIYQAGGKMYIPYILLFPTPGKVKPWHQYFDKNQFNISLLFQWRWYVMACEQ